MAVFFYLFARIHLLILLSSKLIVPSPLSKLSLKMPPFWILLTQISVTLLLSLRLNYCLHSYLDISVSYLRSWYLSSIFAVYLLLQFYISCSDTISIFAFWYCANYSRVSSLGSLSFDPMEPLERADLADLTSFRFYFTPNVSISLIAF